MHAISLSDFLGMLPFEISFNLSEIFSPVNSFLIFIAASWLLIASIQDFKNREVENWWSFGMIVFALGLRAFISAESMNIMPFVWGIIGFSAGFVIATLFYYGRMFAAGDSKVLMAIGTILPLSLDWRVNAVLFFSFIFLTLLIGGVYGLIYSFSLVIINCKSFRRCFVKDFKKHKAAAIAISLVSLCLALMLYIMDFPALVALALLVCLSPFLLIYGKAVEESCMTEFVDCDRLTVGDWIAKPVRAGRKMIKPYWEGLNESELKLIQKKCRNKKILVKSGIPFVPVFLFALIFLFILI